MAETHSTGNAMKNPQQSLAGDRGDAGQLDSGSSATPAATPVARPRLPGEPIESDTNLSVAGEEDPGAALDSLDAA